MGPDPPSPAGGDRSGESVAIRRMWVGAGAVRVHDSQGESARAFALQLQFTPAVDVTRLLGTAIWGPDWALGWVKLHEPRGRVNAPTVAPSGQLGPRQRGDQQWLRPVAGGRSVPARPSSEGMRVVTQSGLTGGWHPRYLAGCPEG